MQVALRDIHKYYGPVQANAGIDIEIAGGSIHGILGENGAGKSTLMKILAGFARKTRGEILLDGRPIRYTGPAEATRLGIGMLYQDPLDFPPLSVLENFMMGRLSGIRPAKAAHRRLLREFAVPLAFDLDPDAPVQSLTVGERQQLELLRLLALGVRVLILDEPTTGISSVQKEILFRALRKLSQEGRILLLVSHKLEDIESLCDRVTVLRQGRVAGHMEQPFDTRRLLGWMFGTPPASPSCPDLTPGAEVLSMAAVSAPGGRAGLKDCTITVRAGEVVGLAGLEGSGQGVFLRLAAGLRKPLQGKIRFSGADVTGRSYHGLKKLGAAFIPAARLEEGLIPGLTITEHFALQTGRGIVVDWAAAEQQARSKIEQYRVVGRPASRVEALSGGNQQRLLLALMPASPRLLLLEYPTRGLDLDSVRWIWQQLTELASRGTTILFSAAELEEIFQVAGRVLVFFNGRVVKDARVCDSSPEEIGQAIAGK